MLISSLIFVFFLISHTSGNELSRCCAGGSRHFREHGNCQSVRAVGSSPTCSRAGSICCLRAVIDSSCQAGFVYAQRHKVCSTVIINELAGGIKRECCDCCLLAKELVDRGEPCIAPTGFSPDCLNSFNKCCNRTEHGSQSNSASSAVQSVSLSIDTDQTENGKGTGCEAANCEHLCTIREDGTSQCSCRSGFDLAPDGRTCVDIDECELLREHWTSGSSTQALLQLLPAMFRGMPLCDPRREVCINTKGGYGCRPAASTGKSIRRQYIKPKARPVVNVSASLRPKKQRPEEENLTGKDEAVDADRFAYQTVGPTQAVPAKRLPFRPTPLADTASGMLTMSAMDSRTTMKPMTKMVVDVDECVSYGDALCSEFNTQCLNTEGAFSCVCSTGFYWSDGGSVCVDIDECLLLVDDCLESQRCLNTPGGYKCIRTQSCGTGYAMDSQTEQCVDVDECTLGAHDCGPMYQCKNTQGSFRCVPIRCADDQVLEPSSGECKSVNCPSGYRPVEGRCEDIDECKQQIRPCPIYEECVNTPGGYRCQEQGNVCTNGYFMDNDSGFCLDIDECQRGTHTCGKNGACINLPGTFRCDCAPGFEFNEYTMRCEDIDECVKFAGHACSLQADCINSIGSYHCLCKPGFRLAADNRSCDDIDECAMGIARCQQKCINSPGSYQCICDRGYQLGLDESTCEDIDECAIWAKSGSELCMGKCINTPGSFLCTCPVGYEILPDGITCKDIDECAQQGATNLCPGENSLCINLLGSYRCQRVECPRNYLPDRQYKNRCVKKPGFCENLILERCKKLPVHISWQHIAIPKQINISHHRTSVTLFSMKGPSNPNSTMQFELHLISAKPDFISVTPAVRANFLLQKGEDHNSATIALRDSLDGPQEVHLELVLRLNTNGVFNGKYVANLMVYVSQYRPQPQHDRLHRQHHRSRRFHYFF